MSDGVEILQACRLSVILPLRGNRARAELGVRSLLEQADPIGTEIIAVDDDPDGSTIDYLKGVFPEAVRELRLRFHACSRRTGDWGWIKNEGAQVAQGAYLSFLHPEETWQSGGLARVEPLLYGNDLILASDSPEVGDPAATSSAGDGILRLLESGRPVKSSLLIRRALWDEIGGFPEGYSGLPFPQKLPGDENYELWLRALILLLKTDRRARFAWVANRYIVSAPTVAQWNSRIQTLKQAISLGKLAPQLPRQYWALLGMKAVGTVREGWARRMRERKKKKSISD